VPIVFRSVKLLKEHPGRVIGDARKADVVITEHGTPTVLLCALAEHELEGAVLMQSPAIRRRMKRALQQIGSGCGVSLGSLMQQIATRSPSPRDPVDVGGAARQRRPSRPIAHNRQRRQ
jgi:hypothetical protein